MVLRIASRLCWTAVCNVPTMLVMVPTTVVWRGSDLGAASASEVKRRMLENFMLR